MTVATSSKSHLPRRYRPRLIRSGRLERALQWAPGFYGAQEPGIVGIAFKSKPALILACELPATRHGRSAIRRRASGRRGPWSARPYRHIASFGENGGPGLSAPSMTASFAGQDSPFILSRLGKQPTTLPVDSRAKGLFRTSRFYCDTQWHHWVRQDFARQSGAYHCLRSNAR